MAGKKKIAYWLLPAAALCVAAVGLAITPSYARYENTAAWYTVATPAKAEVTSPFLAGKDRHLTVMAGQMGTQSQEISFAISSSGDTAAVLQYQVDKAEFLDVAVRTGETPIASGDTVSVSAAAPMQITITLTPTEKASQPHERLDAHVMLSYGDSLAGIFLVELPAVEGTVEEQPQPGDQVEPEGEETTQEPASVETRTETTEENQTEQTPSEETPPEETPSEETPSEETPSEETPPEETPPVPLSAPAAWNLMLPVPLTVTAQTDQIVSLQLFAEDALQPLPAATRFSMDSGATWFALYQPGKVELPVTNAQTETVLLDLSYTELKNAAELTFATGDGAQAKTAANTGALYEVSSRILTRSGEITLTMPALFAETTFVYSIDMLTATEEGTVYSPAVWGEDTLQANFAQTEQGYELKLSIGEKLPPAGTYRLNLFWQAGKILLKETQEYFFIHYGETAGGERQ